MHRMQFLLFLYLLLLVGCSSIGPASVHMDRRAYNHIVKQTLLEELLLNIVRRRYQEDTTFIQVGSLTSSYSLSEQLSAEQNAQIHPKPVSLTTTLSPGVNYSDNPTLTFIPLGTTDFATSMMNPITMNNLLLVAATGYHNTNMLMRLAFERFNDLDGDLQNRAGQDYLTDEYIKVNQIIDLIEDMAQRHYFEDTRATAYQKDLGIVIRFKPGYENKPKSLQLKSLLSIDLKSKQIFFFEHSINQNLQKSNNTLVVQSSTLLANNIVYIRFRSLLDIFLVLSRGVQVPCNDLKKHLTRELIKPDGTVYDWSRKMKKVMTIYSSNNEPMQNVMVKIFFAKHWFYIKADDLMSKDSMETLSQLYTITSATQDNSNTMPTLTLPLR